MSVRQCAWRMGQGLQRGAQAIGMTGIVRRPAMTEERARFLVSRFSLSWATTEAEQISRARSHVIGNHAYTALTAAIAMLTTAATSGIITSVTIAPSDLHDQLANPALGFMPLIGLAATALGLGIHDDAVNLTRAIAVLYGNRRAAHQPTT